MFSARALKTSATLAFALGLGISFNANAIPTNFSFAGTFGDDDDVQLFNFTANGASTVSLVSFSYAGGTQANGNVVVRGGFDPILALFDSSGALVGQNDDSSGGELRRRGCDVRFRHRPAV